MYIVGTIIRYDGVPNIIVSYMMNLTAKVILKFQVEKTRLYFKLRYVCIL